MAPVSPISRPQALARSTWAAPDGDHDHVCGQLAGGGLHAAHAVRFVGRRLDRGYGRIREDLDALGFHVGCDLARHVGVERREDLGQPLDHRDAAAGGDECFGDLDADQAAADDDHIGGRALGQKGAYALGVLNAMEREDVAQVAARDGRRDRLRAGGEDEPVVRQLPLLAAREIAHSDLPALAVDGDGLGAALDIHVLDVAEEGLVAHGPGRRGHEIGLVADDAGHVVREAAAGVREEHALLDDGDVGVGRQARDLGRGLGPGRDAADDDDPQALHQGSSFRTATLRTAALVFALSTDIGSGIVRMLSRCGRKGFAL